MSDSPPAPEQALLSVAADVAREGTVVTTYANAPYLPVVLNWLIAMERVGIGNAIVVALDRDTYRFLSSRGFATALVEAAPDLQSIVAARVQTCRRLLSAGLSVIQSDADAVWLRDPRASYFDHGSESLIISEGVSWPPEAYDAWGFVMCAGLFAMRSEPETVALVERWERDVELTGSDQKSLNRLLMADGLTWWNASPPHEAPFKHLVFRSFDEPVTGACSETGVRVRLLPHALFQRVPVNAPAPYVVHYLPDRAHRPETQALTATGSWFLKPHWRSTSFKASSLDRIAVEGALAASATWKRSATAPVPPRPTRLPQERLAWPSHRIVIASHHKSGTQYAWQTFNDLCLDLGGVFWFMEGTKPDRDWNFAFHSHGTPTSLVDALVEPYRILHFIRHPKAMIVSGARYHLDAEESWLDQPQRCFDGRTYREAIGEIDSEKERVRFEMHHEARRNILDMVVLHEARQTLPIVTVRLEDVSHDRTGATYKRMLTELGFEGEAFRRAQPICVRHALWSMTTLPSHARGGVDERWREVFDEDLDREFRELFGDAVRQLGYS